jgi:hypothetical protein
MRPRGRTKLAPALIAALASAQTGPPPILQLAVLPSAARVRRQRRSVADTATRARRRLSDGTRRKRARGPNLRPRLPLRDSYARGPP